MQKWAVTNAHGSDPQSHLLGLLGLFSLLGLLGRFGLLDLLGPFGLAAGAAILALFRNPRSRTAHNTCNVQPWWQGQRTALFSLAWPLTRRAWREPGQRTAPKWRHKH
eukprot:25471-Prymnesium_polylepis.1